MNPNSQYYLSFDLGYPNAYDRAYGRTGAQLMVHGDCSSRGCYSMTDEQISEIYALGRDAFFGGQKSFQVQAYPFRMTAQNLAKHRNNPHLAFWKMLKKGNDHFEVTRPRAQGQRLREALRVRRAVAGRSSRRCRSAPPAKCPAYEVPEEIASAVRDKEQQGRDPVRRPEPPQHRDRADQDQRRRRHASGVRRRGEEEPDRRRAAGSRSSSRRRPEPFRRRCGRRASRSLPTRRSWPASRRRRIRAARWRRTQMAIAEPGSAATQTDGQAARACSAACSRRRRRPRPRKPSPPRRRATARSIAWRAWSACARTRPATPTPPSPLPKPKPAATPSRAGCREWRDPPETGRARRCKTTEAQSQAPAPAAAAPPASNPFPPPPAPQRAPAPANGGGLNGAAPVVPTGNFDSRWSGFR